METLSPILLIFVVFVAGMAGFIDAIAGGGGLITLPAYLLTGMPAHNAYAVNKFAAVTGTTIASVNYFKNGAMDIKAAIVAAIGSGVGSAVAAQIVMILTDSILRYMVLIAIPIVAVIVFTYKGDGDINRAPKKMSVKKAVMAFLIGTLVGAYDGLIGPGTGTFAIIAFAKIMKYDLLTAGGNAKVVNFASNIAAMITFMINGLVIFKVAIPCAIATIIGSQVGSHMALNKGAKFIKPMMMVVVVLMLLKMAFDLIK